jgi:hypothetical protein
MTIYMGFGIYGLSGHVSWWWEFQQLLRQFSISGIYAAATYAKRFPLSCEEKNEADDNVLLF